MRHRGKSLLPPLDKGTPPGRAARKAAPSIEILPWRHCLIHLPCMLFLPVVTGISIVPAMTFNKVTGLLICIVAVDGCAWYCGQWTCPWGDCHDCWGGCTDASRVVHGQTKLANQKHGTPKGYKRAQFVDNEKSKRSPPTLDLSGLEYSSLAAPKGANILSVVTDVQPKGMSPPRFTMFHLGTNWPIYSPAKASKDELAPVLLAAGIRVWRWPGGPPPPPPPCTHNTSHPVHT